MDGADLLSQVGSLFTNFNALGAAIWAGLATIMGFLFLLGTSRDLLPVLFNKDLKESPQYRASLESFYRKIIVIVVIALLPVFIPLLITFFNGLSSIASSFSSVVSN